MVDLLSAPVIIAVVTAILTSVLGSWATSRKIREESATTLAAARDKFRMETMQEFEEMEHRDRAEFRKELREEVNVLRKQCVDLQTQVFRCETDKLDLLRQLSQHEAELGQLRRAVGLKTRADDDRRGGDMDVHG